jgi:hypothetical protein
MGAGVGAANGRLERGDDTTDPGVIGADPFDTASNIGECYLGKEDARSSESKSTQAADDGSSTNTFRLEQSCLRKEDGRCSSVQQNNFAKSDQAQS